MTGKTGRWGSPDAGLPKAQDTGTELAVIVAFFVSGAAGLMFENVWFHATGLVFGTSIWSTSIVLSAFMAGLALGNTLIGWYAWRIRRLLFVYVLLEATAAIAGVVVTFLLPALTPLLVLIAHRVRDHPWLLNAFRGGTAFVLLTMPATAMGATLPVLVPAVSRRRAGFGRALGCLYGWNTLGAVAGVLCAELVLIPRFGTTRTAWCAGSLNGVAAGVVVLSSLRKGTRPTVPVTSRSIHREFTITVTAIRLLACAFLTGGALMALEVIWFRFLSMFIVNSTLTLSLMLAVVLTAISAGGIVASNWLKRQPQAPKQLSAVAFAAGCTVAGSYLVFQFLTAGSSVREWYRILWFAGVMTFTSSALSGVLFTLIGEALRKRVESDTHAAGWLTLANTTGAMCGPLVASFVLLPILGMEKAFFALALVYCLVGVLALPRPFERAPAMVRVLTLAAGAAVLTLILFPFGSMTRTYFARSAATYTTDGSAIFATREGSTETIFLLQQKWLGRPTYYRLVTNGFSMSGTHLIGKRYMRSFVYWPMLLHRTPLRHLLVLCYGVGVTAGAATALASADSIDVAEISRDVIAMSDFVYPPADRPLRDPRVRLHLEDGRQFLQLTDQRFDVITGEPPPPLTVGTVNLYTREFFHLVYDRLAEGGVATYWLPVARDGEYRVEPIIRAFCDVFEDCSLWNGTVFDWMLVGTRHGRGVASMDAFAKPWNDPLIGPQLREIGFELPQQIGATFMADAPYLKQLTAGTPPLTDDYPRRLLFERYLADPRVGDWFREMIDTSRARTAFNASRFIKDFWPEPLREETLQFFDLQRLVNRVMLAGANPLRDIEQLDDLLMRTTLRRLPLWVLGSDDVHQQLADTGNDGTGMVEYELGVRLMAFRNYRAAASYFRASEQRGFRAPSIGPLRTYALCLAGEMEKARELAPRFEAVEADQRHFWTWMKTRCGIGPTASPMN
jgi:predicted membrane-bound spermidine synthase